MIEHAYSLRLLAPKSNDKACHRILKSTKLHELRDTWATRQLMAGSTDDVVAKC